VDILYMELAVEESRYVLTKHNLHLEKDDGKYVIKEDTTGIMQKIHDALNEIVASTPEDPPVPLPLAMSRKVKIFWKIVLRAIIFAAKTTATKPKLALSILIATLSIRIYFKLVAVFETVSEKIKETVEKTKTQVETVKTAINYQSKALVIRDLEVCINENVNTIMTDFLNDKTVNLVSAVRSSLSLPSSEPSTSTSTQVSFADLRTFAREVCEVQHGGATYKRLPLDVNDRTLDPATFQKVIGAKDTVKGAINMLPAAESLVVPAISVTVATLSLAYMFYRVHGVYKEMAQKQQRERAIREELINPTVTPTVTPTVKTSAETRREERENERRNEMLREREERHRMIQELRKRQLQLRKELQEDE
jgi:hypothetical protein